MNFDFTRGGNTLDLLGAGNSWQFTDSTGMGIALEARAWSIDSTGAVSHATVLQSATDYQAFGYRQIDNAQGLVVPIPSAAWLMLSGLLVLAGAIRRRS